MRKQTPNASFWERETFLNGLDIVVLGSGIVGLSAALRLRESLPKAGIAILERGMLPTGASTRNAGFACFGSVSELLDDLKHSSEDEVLALVQKRWEGLRRLRGMVGADLEYDECGGYELFFPKGESEYQRCMEAIPRLNEKLAPIIGRGGVYRSADGDLPRFGFKGVGHLILNTAEGHIHTGKMMMALLRLAKRAGIHIFNGAEVEGLEDGSDGVRVLLADGREIHAAKALVATNGFAPRLLPGLDLRPARNQVLITKPIAGLRARGTFHYDEGYYYFRNVGDRLLFGGGRNLAPQAEQTDEFGTTEVIKERLLAMLGDHLLPDTSFEVEMWWSGILGVGSVKRPIIQRLSDNVAVAARMGGMGIAIGSLVGREGAEALLGSPSAFSQ